MAARRSPQTDTTESKSSDALYVSAPLVVVRTTDGRAVNLYRGDVITEGVSQESIDHLTELGFLSSDAVDPRPGLASPDED